MSGVGARTTGRVAMKLQINVCIHFGWVWRDRGRGVGIDSHLVALAVTIIWAIAVCHVQGYSVRSRLIVVDHRIL